MGNTALYSADQWFESPAGGWLFWEAFVFLSPTRKIL